MLYKFTLRLEHISAIYVCSLKGYYHGNINMRCDWLHWSPSLVSCTEPENRTPVHSFTSAPVHPRVYACVGGSSKVLMKFWAYFRTRNVRFSHCTYFVIVLYILLWLLSHYISFKFLVGGIISVPPQPPHPSPPLPSRYETLDIAINIKPFFRLHLYIIIIIIWWPIKNLDSGKAKAKLDIQSPSRKLWYIGQ